MLVREHLSPAEAGRRLGVILLFGTLGMALGGWLAGYIFDATGSYTPAFLVGAAFSVANLIIVLGLIARTRAGGGTPMRPAPARVVGRAISVAGASPWSWCQPARKFDTLDWGRISTPNHTFNAADAGRSESATKTWRRRTSHVGRASGGRRAPCAALKLQVALAGAAAPSSLGDERRGR